MVRANHVHYRKYEIKYVTLTDQNVKTVSPELVTSSFAVYFFEVAHVLDAKIPMNNIHDEYLFERKKL